MNGGEKVERARAESNVDTHSRREKERREEGGKKKKPVSRAEKYRRLGNIFSRDEMQRRSSIFLGQ